MCTAVELGIKERLYFQRVIVPAIENDNGDLVKGPRREWLPVTGPVQIELFAILRNDLRPTPVQRNPPKGAAQSRIDFEAAIAHRPEPRGTGIGR
jgi:hypothetical protein